MCRLAPCAFARAQAGPDCPPLPLLQAPSLRTSPTGPATLGLRYSGM
jgi:hypothetical protein